MRSTYAQWLKYAAYTLLVTAVVVGGYYFVYVQQRTEQLANDRLAMLQESSGYFADELGRVKRNLRNTLQDTAKTSAPDSLSSALQEISDIVHVPATEWTADSPCHTAVHDSSEQHQHDTELYARFEPSVNHPHLSFEFPRPHSQEDGADEEATSCRLAGINPDSLLSPLLPRSDTAFDKVFLARRDGRVLVAEGTGPISVVQLPLRSRGITGPQASEDTSQGLYSEMFTMEAAGVSHRVFLQPFTVPVDILYSEEDRAPNTVGAEREEVLYLAGVKQEQAFRAEARMLPPTVLAILLGVVVLALLAFPFLEIGLIGPTEAFRPLDVFEVALGMVIASSVVTLAVLGMYALNQREGEKFERLEGLSRVIRSTLETEAITANRQLTRLTGLMKACDSACRQQTRIWHDSLQVDGSATSVVDRVIRDDSASYPHLEMASWIDRKADQVAKWSVEDQTTPLINLSDRGYVRAHETALQEPWTASRHSEVWQFREEDSTRWVLESIRSKNTGEVFAQISQRRHPPVGIKGDTSAVVAASTLPLLSLIEPVLPPGYRFAVIDDAGTVLFHSDTRRNLRENIFEKMIGGEHLRDAVLARRADRATARYRESTYQFYASPVRNSPWTLLVFGETEPLRAMHGHILTSGLGLYAAYLLLLLGLGLLPWLGWKSYEGRAEFSVQGLFYALWPDHRKAQAYRTLLGWEGSILGVGLVLLAGALATELSVAPLLGIGLLASGALFCFCYYGGQRIHEEGDDAEDGRPDWATPYLGSLSLLVINIAVVPICVSYTVLHDESAELLTKRHQRVFAERLQARGEDWVDHYRDIALDSTARDTLNAHLFPGGEWSPENVFVDAEMPADTVSETRPWDVHTVPGVMEVAEVSREDCAATGVDQPINDALGRYLVAGDLAWWGDNLHLFSRSTSSDRSLHWTTEADTFTFCMESARRDTLPAGPEGPDRETLRIRSTVPTVAGLMAGDLSTALVVLFFVVVLPGLLWGALRALHARLFFVDLMAPAKARRDQNEMAPSETPARTLFLRGVPDDAFDASEIKDVAALDALLQKVEASDGPIRIENFHEGLGDPEAAEKKRRLLHRLVEFDRDVEVYSDVDPLLYLRQHFRKEATSGSVPIDLNAWATVLRAFHKRPGRALSKEDCIEFLNEHRRASRQNESQEVRERLAFLAEECRGDPHLCRRVGPIVARDPNFETLSEDEIVEEVRYHARAHYQHLWMTCTDEEKVVLHRLSTDGFVSPRGRDLVEQLLRRRLLVMDPHLRPMANSFRRFVAKLDSPVIARYEEEASSRTWNRVRVPLLIAFAIVIGFVFVTQPNLAEQTAALVPALAAGLPALINIVSGFLGGSSSLQVGGKSQGGGGD